MKEDDFLHNVLIVGNIGNGKSTVTNMLAGREKDVAKAAAATGTTTIGMNVYDIKEQEIRILDTQGFGCPKYSDARLYNSLCLNFFEGIH